MEDSLYIYLKRKNWGAKLSKYTNKKYLRFMILVFFIACLLIFSCFFIITYPTVDRDDNADESLDEEIDDRISPLTNQGLTLEINRIRHRGLLEKIMKFGSSWRKKPIFYVVTTIDKEEYSSYEEYGFAYNSWDTIGQDFRIIKDVEEEQSTSQITITVIEQLKKGIFRKENIETENIQLVYDYRNGRWTGGDSFDDSDGYGHYVGNTFEIWFNIYQTDYDQDGIPYWAEVNVIKTDPRIDDSKLDPDGDGIPTSWEWKWNYDPKIWDDHVNLDPDIDGLENIEEYQMHKWFANPFSQDIYVEVDGMKKRGLLGKDHTLFEESKQIVIERFCLHGINIYIDNGWPGVSSNGGGEVLPHVKNIISWDSGIVLQYYKHNFADERKEVFRYILICYDSKPPGFCGNAEFNRFDTIVLELNIKTKLLTWLAFSQRTQRLMLASSMLHELGHSFGIGPNTIEGCDNNSFKNKFIPSKARSKYLSEWGNYKSVMNYYYIYEKNIVDFSDGSHGHNDQNDWEKFYLPFFQIEVDIVVDPFYYPITKRGVDENVGIKLEGWSFSEDLTQKYVVTISDWSPVNPIKCSWRVYIKTDEDVSLNDRNIRIYDKPIVPFSVWSLFKEGYLDEEGKINLS